MIIINKIGNKSNVKSPEVLKKNLIRNGNKTAKFKMWPFLTDFFVWNCVSLQKGQVIADSKIRKNFFNVCV